MRLALIVMAVLLPAAAAAQTPASPAQKPELFSLAEDDLLIRRDVERMPPTTKLRVVTDGIVGIMTAEEVLELLRQGRAVRQLRSMTMPDCAKEPDNEEYSKLVAEQDASAERFERMKRRGEIPLLQQQYEQELYYGSRWLNLKRITCASGDPLSADDYPVPEMTKKACEALGAVCKPRKHW